MKLRARNWPQMGVEHVVLNNRREGRKNRCGCKYIYKLRVGLMASIFSVKQKARLSADNGGRQSCDDHMFVKIQQIDI